MLERADPTDPRTLHARSLSARLSDPGAARLRGSTTASYTSHCTVCAHEPMSACT